MKELKVVAMLSLFKYPSVIIFLPVPVSNATTIPDGFSGESSGALSLGRSINPY
jgi:hypothetical protein